MANYNPLLPMANAVIQGLEQTELALNTDKNLQQHPTLDQVLLAGGSKRGWASYLAFAYDSQSNHPKIKSVAPIVMPIHLSKVFRSLDSYQLPTAVVGCEHPSTKELADFQYDKKTDTPRCLLDRIVDEDPQMRALLNSSDLYYYLQDPSAQGTLKTTAITPILTTHDNYF